MQETRSPLRVLIVDDQEDFSLGIARLLRLKGFHVETENDGLAGLNAATTGRFDVLLLDLGLPQLDGYEVARRLRNQDATRHLKIYALSGLALEDHDEDLGRGLFDGEFLKPLVFRELIAFLDSIDARRQEGS